MEAVFRVDEQILRNDTYPDLNEITFFCFGQWVSETGNSNQRQSDIYTEDDQFWKSAELNVMAFNVSLLGYPL